MEIIIVIAFLAFIGYREWMTNSHIKDLELKLLAKTPQEYATYKNIEKPKKIETKEEDDLIDPFDVSPQDLLKGIE